MLELKNLRSGYDKMPILLGVNVRIEKGEIVSVIGRNGVGKSTLVKTIIGLNRTWDGQVLFTSQDISSWDANKRAKLGIAYVPQGHGVFPELTVEENLLIGQMGCSGSRQHRQKVLEDTYRYFPKLAHRKKQYAGTMSGGEQAMLSIARALAAEPKLILLDEPSEGVQPNIVDQMGDILKQICRQMDLTVLMVEQNLNIIQQISKRSYAMDKGMIVAELSEEQLGDADVINKYLTI